MQTKKHTLRRLLNYIAPHWRLILASTLGGILKLTLPLVLPQVMKYFTDVLLITGNPMTAAEKIQEIIRCLFFLLGIYIFINIPAAFIRQAGCTEVANRVMHKMRCQLFAHMQLMSAQFHHDNKSGSLVTRVNNDVDQVYPFIWDVATNIQPLSSPTVCQPS